jgi:hypothetical protein
LERLGFGAAMVASVPQARLRFAWLNESNR